jgi:hypothetical protein
MNCDYLADEWWIRPVPDCKLEQVAPTAAIIYPIRSRPPGVAGQSSGGLQRVAVLVGGDRVIEEIRLCVTF